MWRPWLVPGPCPPNSPSSKHNVPLRLSFPPLLNRAEPPSRVLKRSGMYRVRNPACFSRVSVLSAGSTPPAPPSGTLQKKRNATPGVVAGQQKKGRPSQVGSDSSARQGSLDQYRVASSVLLRRPETRGQQLAHVAEQLPPTAPTLAPTTLP